MVSTPQKLEPVGLMDHLSHNAPVASEHPDSTKQKTHILSNNPYVKSFFDHMYSYFFKLEDKMIYNVIKYESQRNSSSRSCCSMFFACSYPMFYL